MNFTAKARALLARFAAADKHRTRLKQFLHDVKDYWSDEWQRVSHRRLYIATIAACAVLFGTAFTAVTETRKTQAWLQVYTDGTYVGMVPDDPQLVAAMKQVAEGYHVDVRFVAVHTHVAADYDWQTVASIPTEAVAITLNGKPLLYTHDANTAHRVLAAVLQALTPKNIQYPQDVHFVGNVSVQPVVVGAAKVMSEAAAVHYILAPHAVGLPGRSESLSDVRPVADVKKAGGKGSGPLLSVAARQTVMLTVPLPYPVQYTQDNHLGIGAVKVVKPGKQGKAEQQVVLTYVDGQLADKQVLSQQVLEAPVTELALQGTNPGYAVGAWVWPCASYTVTSPFGWRNLDGYVDFHPGIDIGCPVGTPVYASNNGVVEDAGWNSGGYGIWIRINNGGGIETIYGHLSHVAVHAGQVVAKGQVIGYSGQTGFATGPHLHYEVRVNGVPVQPAPYM